MRKIYLTLLLVAAFGWASAQSLTPNFHELKNMKFKSVEKTSISSFNKAKQLQNTKSTATRWFYQPDAFNAFNTSGDWADFLMFTVFPDSTMLWGDASDPTSHIFLHSMAVSMDPASPLFETNDPLQNFDINTEYTFDSVAVGYIYQRHTAANIVDTLVMQIQLNSFGWTLQSSQYSWVQSIYGVSEMRIEAVLHKDFTWDANGHPDANVIATYKFPLTAGDTTAPTQPSYIQKAIGDHIPAGVKVKASFTFIPGYTWTANTDSIGMYNQFSFITFGNASKGMHPYYEIGDHNTNAIFTTWEFRDSSDTYSPAYFYIATPLSYQYHDVYMKFTALNIGIEENTNVLEVKQNQPNPFTGSTTVNYTLNNSANVAVVIYNVAGAKVMSINEGTKAAGSHSLRINASDLQAGVYYYTFTADGYTVTKKMIVY